VIEKSESPDDDLVEGAEAVAEEYWGDRKKKRRVYINPDRLPLFSYRGKLCAYRSALRAHKEAVRLQHRELRDQMTKAVAETRLAPLATPRRQHRRQREAAKTVMGKRRTRRQRDAAATNPQP
jgi:hypothetical protein